MTLPYAHILHAQTDRTGPDVPPPTSSQLWPCSISAVLCPHRPTLAVCRVCPRQKRTDTLARTSSRADRLSVASCMVGISHGASLARRPSTDGCAIWRNVMLKVSRASAASSWTRL